MLFAVANIFVIFVIFGEVITCSFQIRINLQISWKFSKSHKVRNFENNTVADSKKILVSGYISFYIEINLKDRSRYIG